MNFTLFLLASLKQLLWDKRVFWWFDFCIFALKICYNKQQFAQRVTYLHCFHCVSMMEQFVSLQKSLTALCAHCSVDMTIFGSSAVLQPPLLSWVCIIFVIIQWPVINYSLFNQHFLELVNPVTVKTQSKFLRKIISHVKMLANHSSGCLHWCFTADTSLLMERSNQRAKFRIENYIYI